MSLKERIQRGMNPGTGTSQWTASQAFFIRTNAVGRWQSDFDTGAFAPAYYKQRNSDGTPCSPVRDPATNYLWIITAEGAQPIHSFDAFNSSQYLA